MKKYGILYERFYKKFVFISYLDQLIEKKLNTKSFKNRSNRRYKSFIGSFLISFGKCNEILNCSNIEKADNILEFGCGDAVLLLRIAKELESKITIGIDIDKKRNFSKLNKVYPTLNLIHMDYRHPYYNPNGNAENLFIPKEILALKFDFLYLYDVVTYMEYDNFLQILEKLYKLLSNGGKLFFNIPTVLKRDINASQYLKDGTIKMGKQGKGGENYQYFWDEELVEKFLQNKTFKSMRFSSNRFNFKTRVKTENFVLIK